MKISIFILIFSSLLSWNLLAQEAPVIDVQPGFRSVPLWYWPNNKKCVPVPTYDIVSRIAPQQIRQSKAKSEKKCELRVDSRRLESELLCGGQLVAHYYSKESLCKEHLGELVSKAP